jgi:hypothetical protein
MSIAGVGAWLYCTAVGDEVGALSITEIVGDSVGVPVLVAGVGTFETTTDVGALVTTAGVGAPEASTGADVGASVASGSTNGVGAPVASSGTAVGDEVGALSINDIVGGSVRFPVSVADVGIFVLVAGVESVVMIGVGASVTTTDVDRRHWWEL